MVTPLDLDQLRTFVAITETGSFTRAAEEVFRTQSAVSMQMRRLEERLGKTLFEKDGRNNRLTTDGEKLLLYARELLRLNRETLAAFDESMQKLGLEYLDLYLIHWPAPKIGLYVKSWEALIRLRDEGRIKSIGVSNFNIGHLQRLLDETGVLPVVNQIELNPRFQQPELRQYHAEHNIVTESWSPLGHGLLWDNPVLAGIAAKHKRSLAQVVLRWHTQLGNVVIPKSITPERIRENFHIFDFKLDADDLAAIAAMHDEGARHGPDPERFRLPKAS